jgi:hypothetical protein
MCSCFRTWNGDKNGNIRLNEMFKFKSYETTSISLNSLNTFSSTPLIVIFIIVNRYRSILSFYYPESQKIR